MQLATSLIVLFALSGCRGEHSRAAAPVPPPGGDLPNIVLVLADDLGLGDLGCYNPQSRIPTPHIDRFAAQARRFTDAHSPSGVCSPTRYGLLTGRYAWRTALKRSVLWGHSPLLIEPDRPTIASLCHARGYATACFGKWHLGLGDDRQTDYDEPLRPGPLELGFDTFQGIPASPDMDPYVWIVDDRPEKPATENKPASYPRRGYGGDGFWRPGPSAPGFEHADLLPRTIDTAIGWIGEQAQVDGPFFAYVALTAPHTPWLPAAEFEGRSGAGPYGDFVAMVDAEIGRLLDRLDELELADDTLVIVTSDNGAHWEPEDIVQYGHLANLQYRGQKGDAWEGGHRVPFLLRWPGHVPADTVEDSLLSLTDLYATLAALFGAPVTAGAAPDSVDASPLWFAREEREDVRESMVQHSFEGIYVMRSGRFKLIAGLGSGGFSDPVWVDPAAGGPLGQLYDLIADPGEQQDLFTQHPDRVASLAAELKRVLDAD